MNSGLPATGTEQLLRVLSPYVPDEFLHEQWPNGKTGGRRHAFSAAQLWRVHLLALLPQRHRVPDVRMLHEFRDRLGVSGARRINERLLEALLESIDPALPAVGLMDATDLEAACRGSKKNGCIIRHSGRPKASGALKPGRAFGLSDTKNTACVCGCRVTNAACFWCRW